MLRVHGLVAVILFAALTLVVSLQVLNRLVLHQAIIWSEEVARFLFFWVVMLGAAYSVRRRRHFVLDVIPRSANAVPGPLRFALDVLPDLCVLGFTVFLLIQGAGYARAGLFRTATNSDINMALVYAAVPTFAALSIVYATVNLISDYREFRAGRVAHPPAPPAE